LLPIAAAEALRGHGGQGFLGSADQSAHQRRILQQDGKGVTALDKAQFHPIGHFGPADLLIDGLVGFKRAGLRRRFWVDGVYAFSVFGSVSDAMAAALMAATRRSGKILFLSSVITVQP
jgi:hypothetical protein